MKLAIDMYLCWVSLDLSCDKNIGVNLALFVAINYAYLSFFFCPYKQDFGNIPEGKKQIHFHSEGQFKLTRQVSHP